MDKNLTYMSRGQLYELVWTKPITHAAKELGISDRGLAKKCLANNIPVPPRGYWAKLEHGKDVRKTPLPDEKSEFSEFIYFDPEARKEESQRNFHSRLTNEQLEIIASFTFPKKIHRYHSVVSDARAQATEKRLDSYGRIEFLRTKTHPGLKVTPKTFDRACRFLNGLADLFKQLGWKLNSQDQMGNPIHNAVFAKDDLEITFEIIERVTQLPLKPYPNAKKRHSRFSDSIYDYLYYQRREYKASGTLEFAINVFGAHKLKTRWKDSDKAPIETRLLEICMSVASAFEIERGREIERAKREKEYERQRKEHLERKEKELRETERQAVLLTMADNLEKKKRVENLILEIEKSGYESDDLEEWLDWTRGIAIKLDPLKNLEELILD